MTQDGRPSTLTLEQAAHFARIALSHVAREYPNKLDHVLVAPEDAQTPRALHPIFYGSFDWHSCVHGYWLLARLLRRFPDGEASTSIRTQLDEAFTASKAAGELDYLARPGSSGFERPYGWAWLLKLATELAQHDQDQAWFQAIAPLAQAFAERFLNFLPRADYPVRSGAHANTAFALKLAFDYARRCGDRRLAALIESKAIAWYGGDLACQTWEPSGDDFLSPTLVEAVCMRSILTHERFSTWFAAFLPELAHGRPAVLFEPVRVSDRSDGKIAHLDGLNLSRAWCWRLLASSLDDPVSRVAAEAAQAHLAASLPHVSGDYMGEHWLATYALLALDPEA